MSGDYSRTRFQPGKHYQGVLRQQGCVDLDADSNEYVDLQDRRLRTETIDVVGRCGVSPATPDAFRVRNLGGQLAVGPGRIYVDGYAAENHGADLQFDPVLEEQYGTSFLAVAALPTERSLVYLDVWRREVTHLQDPELIEPAVNVETTTRYQTAWQVRLLSVAPNAPITCQTPLADVPRWVDRHSPSTARLTTTTVATAPEPNPCLVAPTGGYRSLENHLYRVEVHRVAGTEAGLKWSRENAHVASRVLKIEHAGTTTTLHVGSLGRDEILSFEDGGWVEILADRDEFAGGAGVMRQVTVNSETNQLTVTPRLDSVLFPGGLVDAEQHVRVIRWDQKGRGLTTDGLVKVTTGQPSFVLEHGIQATLDGLDGARVGDYWCIAARAAVADIERLEQAPPRGVHHHFCALAIVAPDGTVLDCRPRFAALTQLGLSGLEAGVHVQSVKLVSGAPLENDSSVPVNHFAEGLVIACDAAIERDTVRNRPTCVVTLDLPYPLSASDIDLWKDPIVGYQQIRLAADTDANSQQITWSPTKKAQTWLSERLFTALAKHPAETKVLAHLVLLGNFVWQAGRPEVWVDGDLFGLRGKSGEAFPTIGRWPTGDGRRGGNLHMWFWLTAPEHVVLTIDPKTASLGASGQQDFTVSVTGTENRAVKFDPIAPGSGSIAPAKGKDGVWTYTAPVFVPLRRTVNITVESVADPSHLPQTALVTLLPRSLPTSNVTISPETAELTPGGQQDFIVRGEGAGDLTVDVSLDPPPGLGTLALVNKNEGRWTYRAPLRIDEPTTESIVASRPKTPNDSARAVVSLIPPRRQPPKSLASATKKGVSSTKAHRRKKGST